MEITFKGNPIELKGKRPNIGDKITNVKLLNSNREEVELKDLTNGKTTVISVIPNVLTRTCELQTKRLQDESEKNNFNFITVGKNTVDEFNGWNKDNGLKVPTYTDQFDEFGEEHGLRIKLDGDDTLARTVFVVDENQKIKYMEIVDEIADEPNYDKALEYIK